MLKQRFEAREHQREPLRRVGHLFHKLVPIAGEAGLRDRDKRCAVVQGRKQPFNDGATSVFLPLDYNPLAQLDDCSRDVDRKALYFRIPRYLFLSVYVSVSIS